MHVRGIMVSWELNAAARVGPTGKYSTWQTVQSVISVVAAERVTAISNIY